MQIIAVFHLKIYLHIVNKQQYSYYIHINIKVQIYEKPFYNKKKNGNNKLKRLKKIEDTRWNSKDAALQAIFHSVLEKNSNRVIHRYLYINMFIESTSYFIQIQ